ncbi:hypothetical protein EDI_150910 [Entamoeba dispar SAW760]|uniref:Nuclear pore protein n=1 Tax=Entamoeba dispar (strain ATCC PRA-260 / SAW760) TaxID=370354 RepID=B0EQ54_ENTDS|nr:uncharacterized protein EDI_150910 [Entamoeba dispar SAW760]EDR23342.1 hypothetical protein EDI_150910 [Entamoeba dispar SAW760]|eukprot:EDR23342.1 hypothetical protein EDI_150910 [Entamoeba dispar SAW760]
MDSLLDDFLVFEQKNRIEPVMDQGLSSLKKRTKREISHDKKIKPNKRITKFIDLVRSLKITKVSTGLEDVMKGTTPSQYFISQYNNLCNDIVRNVTQKSFYSIHEKNEIIEGINIELPQITFPPTVMSSLTEMISDLDNINYDNIVSLFSSNQSLSLAVQYVHGLGKILNQKITLDSIEQSQVLRLSTSVINGQLNISSSEIRSSIEFLELLFVDLLFGDKEIPFIQKITRLNDLADQLLMQLGNNSMLKKRCNAVIYLLIRGGLKNELLNYLDGIDESYLPQGLIDILRMYVNNNYYLNSKQRDDTVKYIPEFEISKDYYGLLYCNLIANVDVSGKYHEVDSIIKYSLDDYIWYNFILYQHNIQKIKEFEDSISKIIPVKYSYLFCIIHHYQDALTLILKEQELDYQCISAILLISSLCIHHNLIQQSTAQTFDLLLKKPLIESNKTFNFNKFIYQFISTYNPPQNTVIALINLLGAPYDREATIKIIMELGRSELLNTDQVSNNPEIIDTITKQARLEKPEVAMMVNSMVGDMNEYLKIINEKAAVMLNDQIGRMNVVNELSIVTESVLSRVTDPIIKNDFFILVRVYGIYCSCYNLDIDGTLNQMNEIGIFPMKFDQIDSCLIRIQSLQSNILRKIMNNIYYEVISLFSEYLVEFTTNRTIYIDQMIPILKEIIKSCFVIINILPQYFIQQQFIGLMNSNRSLLI